jgi:hypothetical protein
LSDLVTLRLWMAGARRAGAFIDPLDVRIDALRTTPGIVTSSERNELNDRSREDERSRVRCDGFWYEVREPPAVVAELLDHGDDDWVELTGRSDGRPVWLRASRVDYVEGIQAADDVAAERFNGWIARVMETIPARCDAGRPRRVKSGGNRRSRLRATSAERWL